MGELRRPWLLGQCLWTEFQNGLWTVSSETVCLPETSARVWAQEAFRGVVIGCFLSPEAGPEEEMLAAGEAREPGRLAPGTGFH